jgi:hypothetical protein
MRVSERFSMVRAALVRVQKSVPQYHFPSRIETFYDLSQQPIKLYCLEMLLQEKKAANDKEEDPCAGMTISEEVRKKQKKINYERALKDLLEWDMSKISPAVCRIWVKLDDGRVMPGMVTWTEMGIIGREYGIEIADLARSIMAVEPASRRLVPTGRLKGPSDLTNEQIRQKITAYRSGKTDELPPPLFADIFDFEGGSGFILCNGPDGKPLRVKLGGRKESFEFSVLRVVFVSRDELETTVYRRTMNSSRDLKVSILKLPPLGQEFSAIKSVLPKVQESAKKPGTHQESQAIEQWVLDDNLTDEKDIERSIMKNGWVTLCTVRKEPYFLKGLMRQARKLKGDKFKIVLQVETISGVACKTARLFHGDNCFALYKITKDARRGDPLFRHPL